MMFPFAPPPGQFLGDRSTLAVPDGPLADDDRTGIRARYPDANDTLNVGALRGRVIPANPFALVIFRLTFAEIVGRRRSRRARSHRGRGHRHGNRRHTRRLDCDAANPPTCFDGSFDLERMPIGHSYNLHAEPLVGLALPYRFQRRSGRLMAPNATPSCQTPAVNTNFNVRILPAS